MKNTLICLAVFLSGCATTASGPDFAPAPTPPDGSGLMYFMRSPLVGGEENVVAFTVDGQDVVELYSKGYSWLHLPQGRHHVKTEHRALLHGASGKMNIVVDVQAGQPYFVERVDEMLQYPQFRSHLKVANTSEAADKIKSYKYTPAAPLSAASAPVAPPKGDASKATVYLYRSARDPAYIDMNIMLSVDGQKLCGMEDRRYAVLYLEPGEHVVKAEWDPWKKPFFASAYEDKSLRFTAELGKTHYLSYQISGRNGSLFSTALVQKTEAQAQPELGLATLQGDCRR